MLHPCPTLQFGGAFCFLVQWGLRWGRCDSCMKGARPPRPRESLLQAVNRPPLVLPELTRPSGCMPQDPRLPRLLESLRKP